MKPVTRITVVMMLMCLGHSAAVNGGPLDTCRVVPKANISAPNVVAPKYVFTTADCCNFCAETVGCVAATYMDYLCSPKGSNETTADPTSTAILVGPSPPSPAPSTQSPSSFAPPTTTKHPTAVPSTFAPTHLTTTAQPTTQPTPQPTERNDSYLVLVTSCVYSDLCSRQLDITCQTFADLSDVCYDDQAGSGSYKYGVRTSGGVTTIDRSRFSSGGCSGTPTVDHPTQKVCSGYLGGYRSFSVVRAPEPAVRTCPYIERTLAPSLRPPRDALYVNGGCDMPDSVHARYGASISLVSDGNIVWWRAFSSADCSGAPAASFADAMDLSYTAASDDGTVTWSCVTLKPPEGSTGIQVAARTVCSNETCQYSTAGGCNSDAAASGSCMASDTGSFEYVCYQGNVVVRQFNSTDCSGESQDVLHPTDQCLLQSDAQYHQWDCADVGSTAGLNVTRATCIFFPPDDSCSVESFSSGTCLSWGTGEWMIVDCSARIVWWRLYNSTEPCEGIPIQSGTSPLSTWYWNADSLRYVEWNCTSS